MNFGEWSRKVLHLSFLRGGNDVVGLSSVDFVGGDGAAGGATATICSCCDQIGRRRRFLRESHRRALVSAGGVHFYFTFDFFLLFSRRFSGFDYLGFLSSFCLLFFLKIYFLFDND